MTGVQTCALPIYQWKWDLADGEFRRALDLEPDNIPGNSLYGIFLTTRGRFEAAIKHGRRAADLEPTLGVILYTLAHTYFFAGRFDDAIQQHLHTLDIVRHYAISYASLLRAYAMKGALGEAGRVLQEWESVSGSHASGPWRAYWLARCERIAEAKATFETWVNSDNPASKSPLSIAIAQVALGETASALSTLEDAVQKRSPAAIWLKVAPELEPKIGRAHV